MRRSVRCLVSLEHHHQNPPAGTPDSPGTQRGASLLSSYDRLKPALDAGCLVRNTSVSLPRLAKMQSPMRGCSMMRPRTSSALAIVRQKVSPAPQPASTHCSHYSAMICGPLPRRLDAISANILQCAAHCLSPSCKPSNVNIWTAYRSESTAYARHPILYDARLAQLNASTRAGFDAGAFSAPHPSDDHFDIDCSLPGVGRANPKSRQEHDPAVSAGRWLRTPGSEYRMRGGIDRHRRRRQALRVMGEGRDCWRHGLFTHRRNLCVARRQPVLVKRNSADF